MDGYYFAKHEVAGWMRLNCRVLTEYQTIPLERKNDEWENAPLIPHESYPAYCCCCKVIPLA